MRKRVIAGMAVAALTVVIGTGVVASGSPAKGASTHATTHVIEHAITDKVIDTGASGDTSGDLLTFHNPVFGPANTTQVGADQGSCIRISPGVGTWECTWTTFLPHGHITVEGPFNDHHDTVLAIIGGTGSFRNVRGTMALKSRNGGTEFDFLFNWIV
jgi:allene oxide cyclase